MAEITSFADALIVVYRGSHCIEILLGPQIVGYNPRKWQKMAEITSFADASRGVYRGVTVNRNPLGTTNRGL